MWKQITLKSLVQSIKPLIHTSTIASLIIILEESVMSLCWLTIWKKCPHQIISNHSRHPTAAGGDFEPYSGSCSGRSDELANMQIHSPDYSARVPVTYKILWRTSELAGPKGWSPPPPTTPHHSTLTIVTIIVLLRRLHITICSLNLYCDQAFSAISCMSIFIL